MVTKRQVLYVAPHGLGDLIMSIRAMEFLADQDVQVSVMVKSLSEREYLQHTTNLNFSDYIVLDEYRGRGKLIGTAALVLRLRRAQFSAAIPQMNVNLKQFDLLLRLAGVKGRETSVSVLRDAARAGECIWSRHKVDMNVHMAAHILGLPAPTKPAAVWPSRATRSTSAPQISLAPGSGEIEAHKRWPASHYAALACNIMASYPNAEIRIYGAPNEADLCKEIETCSNGAAVTADVGSVSDLYEAMRKSDICIANCNGASHVAAHAGATVVGIYGPTQAEHTGAHCSRMFQVTRNLDCSPCYRRGYITGCGNPVCLTKLEVETVSETVLGILSDQEISKAVEPLSSV